VRCADHILDNCGNDIIEQAEQLKMLVDGKVKPEGCTCNNLHRKMILITSITSALHKAYLSQLSVVIKERITKSKEKGSQGKTRNGMLHLEDVLSQLYWTGGL